MTHASTIDLVRTTVSVGEGGALRVGRPMHAGTLSIFPLYHAAPPSSYLLYTDVGPTGRVAVTEVDEAGSVPDLVVVNHCSEPVLLVEGVCTTAVDTTSAGSSPVCGHGAASAGSSPRLPARWSASTSSTGAGRSATSGRRSSAATRRTRSSTPLRVCVPSDAPTSSPGSPRSPAPRRRSIRPPAWATPWR